VATTWPDWRAGMKLTPERLAARQWNSKDKGLSEVNTSGVATLQNDDELFFAAAANATYFVVLTVAATVTKIGGTTPSGIISDWAVPAGTTGFKFCQGPHGSTTSGSTTRNSTNLVSATHGLETDREYIGEYDGGVSLDAGPIAIKEYLQVTTAGTAGNVQWRWAPRNANSNPAQIDALSTIQWVRVG
jgi:hypothetical protein